MDIASWSNLSSIHLSWSDLGWLATAAGFSGTWLRLGSLQRRLRLGEQALERVRATSRTDSLTGLGSQRYFDSERWPLVLRDTAKALTVAFIDLDGLRTLNNQLGHEAGDRMLIRAADAVRSVARGGADEAFRRYNAGDEIVVFFRGAADAAALGARLLRALNAAGVSASIGLDCCGPGEPERRRSLLGRAEECSRTAKIGGKNRVVIAAAAPRPAVTEHNSESVCSSNVSRSVPHAAVSA